jgi:putative restriction endonuclease
MRGFIGNTDYDWYRFLAAQPDIDEVNFWQPSGGGGRFVALSPREPLFRLKSPHNTVAGFGYFASYSAPGVARMGELRTHQRRRRLR